MAKPPTKQPELHTCAVYFIASEPQLLGFVTVPDEASPREAAIEEFKIPVGLRYRLIVSQRLRVPLVLGEVGRRDGTEAQALFHRGEGSMAWKLHCRIETHQPYPEESSDHQSIEEARMAAYRMHGLEKPFRIDGPDGNQVMDEQEINKWCKGEMDRRRRVLADHRLDERLSEIRRRLPDLF